MDSLLKKLEEKKLKKSNFALFKLCLDPPEDFYNLVDGVEDEIKRVENAFYNALVLRLQHIYAIKIGKEEEFKKRLRKMIEDLEEK